jgi:hypothetical protein
MEGMENRRSWALTGLAIRAAYGIGRELPGPSQSPIADICSGPDCPRGLRREDTGSGTRKKRLDMVLSLRPDDR